MNPWHKLKEGDWLYVRKGRLDGPNREIAGFISTLRITPEYVTVHFEHGPIIQWSKNSDIKRPWFIWNHCPDGQAARRAGYPELQIRRIRFFEGTWLSDEDYERLRKYAPLRVREDLKRNIHTTKSGTRYLWMGDCDTDVVKVTARGIPCLAKILSYTPGCEGDHPGMGPPRSYADINPPEPEEVEYELFDLSGYEAGWITDTLSSDDDTDVTEQVLDAIHKRRE